MELTVKIPLGDYLEPESLDRFMEQCAKLKQTPEGRVAKLIRADIEVAEGEPEQEVVSS